MSTLMQIGCGEKHDKNASNSANQSISPLESKGSSMQPVTNATSTSTPDAIFEIGYAYASKNDKKALEIANSLINIKGDNKDRVVSQGYYLKGIYYMNTDQPELALKEFDSSIIASYTFVDAYIEKAILLFDKKQYVASLKTLSKAAEIDRYQADIYFWTAKNHERLGHIEDAIYFYEQTTELAPDYQEAKQEIIKLKSIKK
jgi:tetratricopeptide (TPR) repeat protein